MIDLLLQVRQLPAVRNACLQRIQPLDQKIGFDDQLIPLVPQAGRGDRPAVQAAEAEGQKEIGRMLRVCSLRCVRQGGQMLPDPAEDIQNVQHLQPSADRKDIPVGQKGNGGADQGVDQPLQQHDGDRRVHGLHRHGRTGNVCDHGSIAAGGIDKKIGNGHNENAAIKIPKDREQEKADQDAEDTAGNPLAYPVSGAFREGDHHEKDGNHQPVDIFQAADIRKQQTGSNDDQGAQGKAEPEVPQIRSVIAEGEFFIVWFRLCILKDAVSLF